MKTYEYELLIVRRRKRKGPRVLHHRVFKASVENTPRPECDAMALDYLSDELRQRVLRG